MYLKSVVHKTKTRGSRHYLQFVEAVRTPEGPRQKILVNVGRIDDKTGRERLEVLTGSLLALSETIHLLDLDNDIEGRSSKQFGMELVFRRLFETIGIDEILAKVFAKTKTDFEIKVNRLRSPHFQCKQI